MVSEEGKETEVERPDGSINSPSEQAHHGYVRTGKLPSLCRRQGYEYRDVAGNVARIFSATAIISLSFPSFPFPLDLSHVVLTVLAAAMALLTQRVYRR